MDYEIRVVKQGDPLYASALKVFPKVARWMELPEDDGEYVFFLAVGSNDTILGGAVLDPCTIQFGPLASRKAGFLEDIEVEPSCRGQGIGLKLLRALLDYAWGYGAEYVRWQVDYDNAAGLALYDSVGASFVPEEDPDAEVPQKQYTAVVANPARTGRNGNTG